jgi:hypothetical protein
MGWPNLANGLVTIYFAGKICDCVNFRGLIYKG